MISIHAAQEGCDKFQNGFHKFHKVFQSTQPKRAATELAQWANDSNGISIHAAQEGCDNTGLIGYPSFSNISIHAAQEGCDGITQRRI